MENFYTAYTKVIDNKTYYFVKKFLAFPEFKDVSPVQESYGMHLDFNKACNIAGLYDAKIKEQLLMDMEENVQHAKIIDLNILNYSGKTASN